jgi:serine/threonine protein kinase
MAFAAGVRVGPYEILSLLGVGGMGEVYKAGDTRLHRIIALKTLPAEKVADAGRSYGSWSKRGRSPS